MGWRSLLAFSCGVVLSALVPVLPSWPWLIATAVAAAVLVFHVRTRLLAIFLLGALWFLIQASWQLQSQWPEASAGEIIEIDLVVTTLPEWRGQSIQFHARPVNSGEAVPDRILMRWFLPSGYVQPGQRWRASVRLTPPRGRLDFYGFDYTRYLLSQRVGALGTIRNAELLQASKGPRGLVNRSRQYLAEVLSAESRSLRAASLMRALAIADRSVINDETRDLLAETGTAHLLAISGLHVGMIAMLAGGLAAVLAGLLMPLFPTLDRRRFALSVGLVGALAYALLAGLTLPTQRALIMLSVVGLAFLVRRGLQPGHALLVAFASVLLLDPLSVLATGFWMSFAAVAVLIWTFAWRPGAGSGVGFWLLGLLRAQLMIGVGLLAINAGLFGQIQWTGFPANLVAIPLVGFWVLPNLLLALLMITLDWPATLFLGFCEFGLELLLNYLEWLQAFGPSVTTRPPIDLLAMFMGIVGALWLIAPTGWPARWLGLVLLLPVVTPAVIQSQGQGDLTLLMLDVGQGEAVVLQTASGAVLYDTGPGDGQGADVIGQLLPTVLAAHGRERLDKLIVSSDHSGRRGGLGSMDRFVSEADRYSSVSGLGQACEAGVSWRWGEIVFEFLHPSEGLPDLGPNSSCVLLVRSPGGSVALTGRIDADVERRLIQQYPDLTLDVLVMADGGHRRASSEEFLSAYKPRLALASVARHDRFDRPHQDVLDRLEQRAIEFQSTASCGSLRLVIEADGVMQLDSAVGQSNRFWHDGTDCP